MEKHNLEYYLTLFEYSKEFEKVFLVVYDTKGTVKQANIKELKSSEDHMTDYVFGKW